MVTPRANRNARLAQPRIRGEILERNLGPGAEMADHLRGAQASQSAAGREIAAAREAMQKAAGIEIAGAGGIDQVRDFLGLRLDGLGGGDDQRSVFAPRERRYVALAAHGANRVVEIRGLEKRAYLRLVGEKDIDVAGDEG